MLTSLLWKTAVWFAGQGASAPAVPVFTTNPSTSTSAPQVGIEFNVLVGEATGAVSYYAELRHASDEDVLETYTADGTYTPLEADEGEALYVVSVATNEIGDSDPAASDITDAVLPAAPVFTTDPSTSASAPQVGVEFDVTVGVATGADSYAAELRYVSDETVLDTYAADGVYTPVEADIGEALYVHSVATNAGGIDSADSSATDAVLAAAAPNPENTAIPAITGTAEVGETLTYVPGTWTETPSLTLTWEADGTPIAGATDTTFVVTNVQIGAAITVTEHDSVSGTSATSDPTAEVLQPVPVNTDAPEITGTAQSGVQLSGSNGSWTNTPTGYTYRWLADDIAIDGATTNTYTPATGDVGAVITFEVTATNTGGASDPATSDPTSEVLAAEAVAPVITTLTLPDAVYGESYSFQMEADGDAPVTWEIVSGAPSWLPIDPDTGELSGDVIPTTLTDGSIAGTAQEEQVLTITLATFEGATGRSAELRYVSDDTVVASFDDDGAYTILTADAGEQLYLATVGTNAVGNTPEAESDPTDTITALPTTYSDLILATQTAHIISFLKLAETSGAVAADASGNSLVGAYSGATLNAVSFDDSEPAPSFDATDDYVDWYSAGLASAFNGAAGVLLLSFRVSAAGVWTDTVFRMLAHLRADANNYIWIAKSNINNTINVRRAAGGTIRDRNVNVTPTTTFSIALKWDEAADRLYTFHTGALRVGAVVGSIGTWNGTGLASTSAVIGRTGTGTGSSFSGLIARVCLWDYAVLDAEVAALTVFPS